jgi:autotransporter-associated beta strand protein
MHIKIGARKLLVSTAFVVALPGVASAQTVTNVEATNLLSGFSQLGNTPAGRTVLDQNLATAISINNNSSVAVRNQAISDNTTASLVGSLSNGVNVADGLGPALLATYKTKNSVSQNFTFTAVSANVSNLFSQLNTITTASDSAFIKNFLANGTANGTTPATGVSLPAGGAFNVYDSAYNPLPANANTVGNSRPVQVAPDRIQAFTGPDYFGVSTNTATIFPTLKSNASFPSGHSSEGFTSSILLAMMVPERFQQELTRGAEFGNSRIVLGAHYPLDVIGARIHTIYALVQALNNDPDYTGKTLPGLLGGTITTTNDFQALFASAQADVRALLDTCQGGISACAAVSTNDRFANAAQNKANYNYWLTYGLAPVGPTNLDPVVPVGAEVLLATRFPYLSKAQIRDVLATTELPSGQPLDDGSGYARLNLYNAADGYGAFNGTVTVSMDASKGGLNAYDIWGNNIGDYKAPSTGLVTPGSLVKNGTGTLELSGNDTWSGSTTVNGGTLIFSGTSNLSGALVNNSVVSLTRNDGTAGRTLTVGSYSGGGGSQLVVGAQLSGAGSKVDQLIVTNGIVAGTKTAITVIDTAPGQAGGYDPTGVPVVVVSKGKAASADNFTLAGGPIHKGLFDYNLAYNGDPQWVLVGLPSANAYRLAAVPTGAHDIWFETASMLSDHQAELRDTVTTDRGKVSALWARVYHSWANRDATQTTSAYSSSFTADVGYDKNTTAFMLGVDGGKQAVLTGDDGLLFGIALGYADSTENFADGTKAKFEGPTFGVYGTYTNGGFFADGSFKADLLNLNFGYSGLGNVRTVYHTESHTWGLTGNIGYKIAVAGTTSVSPIATLGYAHAHIDGINAADVQLGFNDENALRGRLGVQLDSILSQGADHHLALSGSANWSTRLSGHSSVLIDSGTNAPQLRLTDKTLKNVGQVGARLEYIKASGWSIFARGDHSFADGYNSTSIQGGFRVNF